MENQFILATFFANITAATLVVYKMLTGAYNVVIFGVTNPITLALMIYGSLIALYIVIYITKILVRRFCNYLFTDPIDDSMSLPKTKLTRRRNETIKSSVNGVLTFFQILASIGTLVSTGFVAYKELQAKDDIIAINESIVFHRNIPLEEKLSWLTYLRQNEVLAKLPAHQWELLHKNLPWDSIHGINELKAYLLIEYQKLPPIPSSSTYGDKLSAIITNHPYLTTVAIITTIAIGAGIWYYFGDIKSSLRTVNGMVSDTNTQILQSNQTIRNLGDQQTYMTTLISRLFKQTETTTNMTNALENDVANISQRLHDTTNTLNGLVDHTNANNLGVSEKIANLSTYVKECTSQCKEIFEKLAEQDKINESLKQELNNCSGQLDLNAEEFQKVYNLITKSVHQLTTAINNLTL